MDEIGLYPNSSKQSVYVHQNMEDDEGVFWWIDVIINILVIGNSDNEILDWTLGSLLALGWLNITF